MADLEGRGIPTVGVATTEFIEGAAAQAKSLGIDPALVFVPHPVQDRKRVRGALGAAVGAPTNRLADHSFAKSGSISARARRAGHSQLLARNAEPITDVVVGFPGAAKSRAPYARL
jgi:hypothetical protein